MAEPEPSAADDELLLDARSLPEGAGDETRLEDETRVLVAGVGEALLRLGEGAEGLDTYPSGLDSARVRVLTPPLPPTSARLGELLGRVGSE